MLFLSKKDFKKAKGYKWYASFKMLLLSKNNINWATGSKAIKIYMKKKKI
jgi:hypothetical protein